MNYTHKFFSSFVMGFCLTFFLVFIAAAQSYRGTKQGEYIPENDKSKIDDQLVKVGEKNNYLYTYPRLNLSVNPFSPLYERLSLSVSYALTMNLAIRADVSVQLGDDYVDNELFGNTTSYSLSAPLYFRKVYSGLYLEPGVQVGTFEGDDLIGFQVLVGWHWIWDSGLNVSAALGLGRNLSQGGDYAYDGSYETSSYGDDGHRYVESPQIYPAGTFRVGYAF